MRRFTYYDDDLGEYILNKDYDLEEITVHLGRLEDEYEINQIYRFSEYIKRLREKRSCTQEDFARLIHEPRTTIANYESGRSKVPNHVLISLGLYLDDVSYEELRKERRRIEAGIDDDYLDELIENMKDYNAIVNEISGLIEYERKYAGLQKSDLSKEIGITGQKLSKIMKGESPIDYFICLRIANATESKLKVDNKRLRDLAKLLQTHDISKLKTKPILEDIQNRLASYW